jgi:peptide-methionine (R)-S-oxide reductase
MHRRHFLALLPAALLPLPAAAFQIERTEDEWRALLTDRQFRVLREADTEGPNTSPLTYEKRAGTYHCAGCDLPLYASETKFESGTGWPSFWQPLPGAVETQSDIGIMGIRTEVHCRRCGGHLGHVFEDGPAPTGLRYCMNGAAMSFHPTA